MEERSESKEEREALGDRQDMEGKRGKEWIRMAMNEDLEKERTLHKDDNEYGFIPKSVNLEEVCVCVCVWACTCVCVCVCTYTLWEVGEIVRLGEKVMAEHKQMTNETP